MNELKNRIFAALNIQGDFSIYDTKCKINVCGNDVLITYGRMYESPVLNFVSLMDLSEIFGTKDIDVDNYANSGCETCDYGSDYGHEISIKNITKNVSEIKSLNGKDICDAR